MEPRPGSDLTRRAVLLGAAGLAGAAALAACSKSTGTTDTASSTPSIPLVKDDGGASLIAIFDAGNEVNFATTGTEQRLAFGVGGSDNTPTADIPASLDFQLSKDGKDVGAPITVAGHKDGVPIGYFPLRTTFAAAGTYTATVQINGKPATQSFSVGDGSSSSLLARGAKLRSVDTPTTADHRGVEPICTRKPDPCPFHALNLSDAMTNGKPIALLISTPEFCQIGVCGPVLELMIAAAPQHPGVQFIHAEVYADAEAIQSANGGGSPSSTPSPKLAPVIDTYGLSYEPALFLADATGTVVDRLDNIFDRSEMEAGLAKLA